MLHRDRNLETLSIHKRARFPIFLLYDMLLPVERLRGGMRLNFANCPPNLDSTFVGKGSALC